MSNESEYKLIDVDSIQPNRYQPRKKFDQKDLQELAESIDTQGLHQAILVRPINDSEDKNIVYELVAGERRWRAHKLLGKKKIQCVIKEMDNDSSIEAAITENLQRKDLTSIEEAQSFAQFMELMNLSAQQVADRLGKSRSYVVNTIRILKLPDTILNMIEDGKLEKWHGIHLLSVPDKDLQMTLAKKTIDKEWNIAKLKKEIEKEVESLVLTENNKTDDVTEEGSDIQTSEELSKAKQKISKIKERRQEKEKAFEDLKPNFQILVQLESEEEFNIFKESLDNEKIRYFIGTKIKKALEA